MAAPPGSRIVRRELPGRFSVADVLALVRCDEHPFALTGAWAGGGAVVGSQPAAVAGPPEPLERVFGGDLTATASAAAAPGSARFAGGWIGYLGYSAADSPPHGPVPGRERALPAWWFGYYDHVLVLDQGNGSWWFEALVSREREAAIEDRYRELASRLGGERPPVHGYRCGEFTVTPQPQAHIDAVRAAVGLIHRGDLFQANITLRLEASFSGDPVELFGRGAAALQPPYAAFLSPPGGAIASFSPELFLRRTGREVTTSPIKGTCRRSDDEVVAARQRAELTGSAKNRAENVMIVDLMRSDLGRVCAPGSVTVPRLAAAEPHPGLWHLVSDVRGELPRGRSDADLVAATFPPGSVTGAPKVRAMEVIGALEAVPREVYTGAIGFRSPVAGLELNVAIRTFEFAAGRVWLGAGGGIVADSDPAAEYAECLVKARPLIEAVASWPAGGELRASAEAVRSALRPRPASGVFTTLRVTAGEPDGLREHLDRLASSARAVFGKDLPLELPTQIEKCLAQGGSGRLRITIWPVGGPLQCRVELTDARADQAAVRLRPVTVAGGLGQHKWADRRLLAELAIAAGLAADEQLLITDSDGSVLETDRANIFAVIGGVLRTPAADGRILPGIGRARALAAARKSGVAVETGPIRLADLGSASEIFVTSALRGIVPVVAVSNPAASWQPGPVADRIRPGWADRAFAAGPMPAAGRPRAGTRPGRRAIGDGPSIVLLDNYDSFTYNLAHLLVTAGCQVEVVRNDEMTAAEVAAMGAAGLVISPGPCGPAEAGICVETIRALHGRIPVLGICLGHEAIAAAYGAVIEEIAPVHGKPSVIEHDGRGIFAGLPAGFEAARYHSLSVAEPTLPACLTVSARTADGVPMAIRHVTDPIDGLQFHPESILTTVGNGLIRNFLRGVRADGEQRSQRGNRG
jgi:para-aminobenzoate synthetase/4-amino-4-deoxychorismate lyase